MPIITHPFTLQMQGNTHIENVTRLIQNSIVKSGLEKGITTIFVKHTTASVLIIEDEPGLRDDTISVWDNLIPKNPQWQHNIRNPGENNGHSHLRGQLQGQSLTIPFNDKELILGTWQEIVIIDFDTQARTRDIVVQIIGE